MIFVNSFPHNRSGTIHKKRKVRVNARRNIFFAKRPQNKNTKILLTVSPRAHFEHLGVETGSILHARHDGHSEIIR